METIFYTTEDIMHLLGCSRRTAQEKKKVVLKKTTELGITIANNRKCLAWLFNEIYGLKPKELYQ